MNIGPATRRSLAWALALCAGILYAGAAGCCVLEPVNPQPLGPTLTVPPGGGYIPPPTVVPTPQPGLQPIPQPAPTPVPQPAPQPTPAPTPAPIPTADQVSIQPAELISPVGSDVFLTATVCGAGQGVPNAPVQWTMTSESVGQFVLASGVDGAALQVSPSEAIAASATTASRPINLQIGAPGTPNARTAVLQRGQAWITARSTAEGQSFVSAASGSAAGGSSVIHWVDAQWEFPPPAINPAGTPHTFTTTLRRHTNSAPKPGWIVRYEIKSGPSAGFAPDMAQVAEVRTNELGQAAVELRQVQAASGVNEIEIQVIRPAELGGRQLVIGRGTTQKTWSSDIALRVNGPAEADIGETVRYLVELSNPAGVATTPMSIDVELPANMSLVSANPPAGAGPDAQRRLAWRVAPLAAGARGGIELNLRADRVGTANVCAQLRTDAGLQARNCATTSVVGIDLDLQISTPPRVNLGDDVTFEMRLVNRGVRAARNLVLVDRYEDGLAFEGGPERRVLELAIGDLGPGQSFEEAITFRVARMDNLCHRVEVISEQRPDEVLAAATACAIPAIGRSPTPAVPPTTPPATTPPATTPPATTPPATTPPRTTPPPSTTPPTTTPPSDVPTRPAVEVVKQGAATAKLGEEILFATRITNTGDVPLRNIEVVDIYPLALRPVEAAEKYTLEENGQHILRWRIDELEIGRSIQLGVRCRCLQDGTFASQVRVTTAEGLNRTAQASVEIAVAEASLEVTIAELNDPIRVGAEGQYMINVKNTGRAVQPQVDVEVELPPEVSLQAIGTRGPNNVTYQLENRLLRFSTLAEIQPGATAIYRVRVTAQQPGNARFSVIVRSQGLEMPILVEETTLLIDRLP